MKDKIVMGMEKWLRASYPPGYDCRQEWQAAVFLFGVGMIFSFRFFSELYDAYCDLVEFDSDFRRRISEGVVAKPFIELMEGSIEIFVPFFLFLTAMAIYHYIYYYQGAKSIYLMRRLPEYGITLKSCIGGTLKCMAAGVTVIVALYLLYFCIYLLVIPAQCFPRWSQSALLPAQTSLPLCSILAGA